MHIAPGFGEDDQRLSEANGIPIGRAVPVDDQGRFTDDVPEWAGQNVFDANPLIIRHLKDLGRITRHETYEHNYPHCWRTDTPIIYKAISSWYVEVTKIRDRLVELNQQINWVPDHVRDGRFGQWLAGRGTGRSAGTGSGVHRSRCGSPTIRLTPASTSTAASTNSRPTSGCGSTICIDRPSTT